MLFLGRIMCAWLAPSFAHHLGLGSPSELFDDSARWSSLLLPVRASAAICWAFRAYVEP